MSDPIGTDGSRDGPDGDAAAPSGPPAEAPGLDELTLPERLVVAAAQDPIRGALVVGLVLFSFAFLIALAFVFPAVALGIFLVLLFGVVVGVAYGVRRLRHQ